MSLADIVKLLPDLRKLRTTTALISGGEPLLNPQWREIVELLGQRGIESWLLTSGLSLAKHADSASRLFRHITVSLDGTNPETYALIRGVDAFNKVCEGIKAVSNCVPTGIRVTVQKSNFREMSRFVTLAEELGVRQLSFLAVDIDNSHSFARSAGPIPELALSKSEVQEFDSVLTTLETQHRDAFASGLIAESPAKLRRIQQYFAAINGESDFPAVRCNAPQYSAVIAADGRVSPCFFIPGPDSAPRAPFLSACLQSSSMQQLRSEIRDNKRAECATCVCSMWRESTQPPGFGLPAGFVENA
jgi:MoaA/NifB/PqqE/SkfB family radical SAM enzyme